MVMGSGSGSEKSASPGFTPWSRYPTRARGIHAGHVARSEPEELPHESRGLSRACNTKVTSPRPGRLRPEVSESSRPRPTPFPQMPQAE